jgi:phage head maturation protease
MKTAGPAVSVGFMPLEQPNAIKDLEGRTTGWEFTSQELLELSAVSLPANPEALARMVSKGFAEDDLARVSSLPPR